MFFLYYVIAFVRGLWRRVAQGEDPRGPEELRRALRQVERIIRLRPEFNPDVVTVHPDRITLEGDTAYEFVRSGHQWLQVPTDDDVDRMADQLCKVGYIDDAFVNELRFDQRIPWDDRFLLEASLAATNEQAKRRRKPRPQPRLLN